MVFHRSYRTASKTGELQFKLSNELDFHWRTLDAVPTGVAVINLWVTIPVGGPISDIPHIKYLVAKLQLGSINKIIL